jgi:3-hydroxyisobutyrate dehydrogenase
MSLNPVIGLIGVGAPAESVARLQLGSAGRVLVHAARRDEAAALQERGAEWRDTAAELARESDVVIAALPSAMELAAAWTGEDGIMDGARPGALLVIATPCGPALARGLHGQAAARGVLCVDVALSELGEWSPGAAILAGGAEDAIQRLSALLEGFGMSVVRAGPPGAAQHARIARRIVRAGLALGLAEAAAYAREAGLDVAAVLAQGGVGVAAEDVANAVARMLSGRYDGEPPVRDLLTDLAFALEAAEALDLDLPGVELLRMLYDEVVEMGLPDAGPEALAAIWEDEGDGEGEGQDDYDEGAPPDLVQLRRR